MANKRMFLRCMICGDRVRISKYYPGSRWFHGESGDELIRRLSDFVDEHEHYWDELLDEDSEHFEISYE